MKWISILVMLFNFSIMYGDSSILKKTTIAGNTSINYLDSTVTLEWESVQYANLYYIYGGVIPYSITTLLDSTNLTTWSGEFTENKYFFEIRVKEPFGMVFIQGGTFSMGDYYNEGYSNELPVHSVTISDFNIGACEVTQFEWELYMPADTYDHGIGDDYPVYYVSWYEIMVYCNRRSIAEGFTPCYSINNSTTPDEWGVTPTNSDPIWDAAICNWYANGYRLPSEAEWEYASRGGIDNDDNYRYTGSNIVDGIAWYDINSGNIAHPVGAKASNQLGIYDMSGNLWEWCWDWSDDPSNDYYELCNNLGILTDPYGPENGIGRVLRGGSWSDTATNCRVARRSGRDYLSGNEYSNIGFRVARSHSDSTNFLLVEGGTFEMGDHYNEGDDDELPVHNININEFFMSEFEVTNQQYCDMLNSALAQGKITASTTTVNNNIGNTQELLDLESPDCQIIYNGSSFVVDAGKENYPAIEVSWYGSLFYCNIKSSIDGFTELYDLNDWSCDWHTIGYRIPTEAEWEYASRGGIHNTDNYRYSGSNNLDDIAWYDMNNTPDGTKLIGLKSPNQLGFYDMSGNVAEWCWDSYDLTYYSTCNDLGTVTDPLGGISSAIRIQRGGSWRDSTLLCRVADRNHNNSEMGNNEVGFRILKRMNISPIINSLTSDPSSIERNQTSIITCDATDTDPLSYEWDKTSGEFLGSGSSVTWIPPDSTGTFKIYCTVNDGSVLLTDSCEVTVTNPQPISMIFVQGGTFEMGTHFDEGSPDEKPVHSVTVSDFYMGEYEVTQSEWASYMPAFTYDYGFGDTYPVYYVKWYEIIRYCNLRSMDEDLDPCYTISGSTDPADWGELPAGEDSSDEIWDSVICNFNANGYRLPTEAEWEYASRGGLSGQRFPNGLTISHSTNGDTQANYKSYWVDGSPYFSYDVSPTEGQNPDYGYSSSPVGSLPPNGYGLYDMSGNMDEWCWDWYGSIYYTTCNDQGTVTNPRGPDLVDGRVRRGGGWHDYAYYNRVTDRVHGISYAKHCGFRVVRSNK